MVFSDETTASFETNEEESMVGAFSDGSTSIRFQAGNGVHSTADGWIINEPSRGGYEVFREISDGVFESPSAEDVMELTSIARETREMMTRIMAGEFSESSSSIQDDESNAEETKSAAANHLEAMSEKYAFVKKIREYLAVGQPEEITTESLLQDMLELMQSGTWPELISEATEGGMLDSSVVEEMMDDMTEAQSEDYDTDSSLRKLMELMQPPAEAPAIIVPHVPANDAGTGGPSMPGAGDMGSMDMGSMSYGMLE